MPSDKPRRTGPAWRNESTSAPRATNARKAWQQEAADLPASSSRRWSKKTKLGLLGLVFLLLMGSIVGWIVWLRPPKPPHLVLLSASNAVNLKVPANVAGLRGVEGLAEWMKANPAIQQTRYEVAADGPAAKDFLAPCRGDLGQKGAEKVILYVGLLGGADSQGCYLIPDQANPADRKQLLRLTVLLDQLNSLPEKTPKLLILDATQVSAHAALGIFGNDFARELKQLEPRIKSIPNLVVICASDEEQRSWVSEEWGQSIFAHYLIEGLKGAAVSRRGHIYAAELYQYVRDRVREWARDNRDALQEPILLGGEDRAAAMELVLANSSYTAPDPSAIPVFQPPAELRQAWEEARTLALRSPEVYAPQLWRQYLDTQCRHEHLLRLNDGDGANEMRAQLSQLRSALADAGRLRLQADGSTLAFGTVFQPPLPKTEETELIEAFEQLWRKDAPPDEYKKLFQTAPNRSSRRLRLLAELYHRAMQSPESQLAKAAALVLALDDPSGLRPAEPHYLAMLQRDRYQTPDWPLIHKALEVRRLAEEASLGLKLDDAESARLPSYGEQVYPWIKAKVEAADLERQLGQDLVFASETADWKKAHERLDQARQLYLEAQEIGLEVRRALRVRDRLFAELPYYSQWLARRRAADEPLLRKVANLWKQLHELDRLLDRTERNGLAPLAKDAQEAFASLKDTFDRNCNELAAAINVVLQNRWHELEDALVVPFIEPSLRMDLVKASREISYTFNAKKPSDGPTITAQQNRNQARAAVRRQAHLALMELGEEWFNATKARPDYAEAEKDLDRPDETEDFARSAEAVARHWNRQAAEARQLTESGRDDEKLDKAAADLRQAARLARRLDGAAALTLGPLQPVDENRKLQVHDLLLAQAERTLRDHWAAEDPKRPYYRANGHALVRDARVLIGEDRAELGKQPKAGRLARAVRLDEQLDVPGDLVPGWFAGPAFQTGKAVVVLTDEERFERVYGITAPATVLHGSPVVWVERGKWLRPPSGSDAGRRVMDSFDAKVRSDTASFVLVPEPRVVPVPQRDDTYHVLHGVFRGQRFEVRTDVQLHRLPDVVSRQHRLPLGGVAVQAPRELYDKYRAGNSAIAIVLDCSGSMCAPLKPGDPPKEGVKRRYDKALDALEGVLEKLPKGTTVSLRVFSQRANNGAATLLWNTLKWDPATTRTRMQQLRNLEPWFATPLIRSLEQAKEDFPAGFKGSKTLVVLTDGGDSDETVDLADIPNRLSRHFRDSGILINAIGFDMSFGTEREKVAAGRFQEGVQKLGGNYFDVKDKDQLSAKLRESMLHLRFWIEQARNGVPPPQAPPEGREIGQIGESEHWVGELPPSVYDLQMRVRANQAQRRTIRINRGDFLLLNLVPRANGFLFERDLYAESNARFGRVVKKGEDASRQWVAAVMQNYQGANDLRLMATIESTKDRVFEGGTLQQIWPRLTLFEVAPPTAKGAGPLALRYGTLAGYPAPAWDLNVAGWPRGVAPTVNAWWTDDDLHAVDDDHPYARILNRGVHFELGANHRPVRAKLAPGEWTEVTLESVQNEEREVETGPGIVEKMSCLVVRLRHPEGKPFLVQVRRTVGNEQRHFTGHEHRFYTAAGKYTGIFWGWTEEELRRELNLELISVEGLKKRAAQVQLPLGVPDNRDRPKPLNIPLHYDERR